MTGPRLSIPAGMAFAIATGDRDCIPVDSDRRYWPIDEPLPTGRNYRPSGDAALARRRVLIDQLAELLEQGLTIQRCALRMGVSRVTIYNYLHWLCEELGPQARGMWRIDWPPANEGTDNA